jgi:hypothetical protein
MVKEGKHGGSILSEDGKMKPVEIVQRREGHKGESGRGNLITLYCKHICKCHNICPHVKLLGANKNK